MPQIRMRDAAGTLRTITRLRMRDTAGILRTIQQVRMRDETGVLRTVFQYLSLDVNTTSAFGSSSGAASAGVVVSSSVTGTVSGGTAPYVYAWERIDGSAGISADTPAVATSTFSATVNEATGGMFANFRLKVTDANGAEAYSDPVFVELYWTDTR